MKEKRNIKNIFQSVVFMLFTFFIFGVNNVSAEVVTVSTFDELKEAFDGVIVNDKGNNETDTSITGVKLGDDITIPAEEDLYLKVINDITLDLNGYVIDANTNDKYIFIDYGSNGNGIKWFFDGSLIITDNSLSQSGTIKLKNHPIIVGQYNREDGNKNYKLTINGGKYYSDSGTRKYLIEIGGNDYYWEDQNITFDFKVNKGYFKLAEGVTYGEILLAQDMKSRNINFNFSFDNLTFDADLGQLIRTSGDGNYTINESIPLDTDFYIYSKSGKEVLIDDRTTVINDYLPSSYFEDTTIFPDGRYAGIKLVKKQGLSINVPLFDSIDYGYDSIEPVSIDITNIGLTSLKIKNVTITGTDFILGDGNKNELAGGEKDSSWKVKPKDGLEVGVHTATITVEDENGGIYTADVSFEVKEIISTDPVTKEVTTLEEFKESIKNSGVDIIKLGADIISTDADTDIVFVWDIGRNKTLDLNGHTITGVSETLFRLNYYADYTVNIIDSSNSGTSNIIHDYAGTKNGHIFWLVSNNDGNTANKTLIINGVNLTEVGDRYAKSIYNSSTKGVSDTLIVKNSNIKSSTLALWFSKYEFSNITLKPCYESIPARLIGEGETSVKVSDILGVDQEIIYDKAQGYNYNKFVVEDTDTLVKDITTENNNEEDDHSIVVRYKKGFEVSNVEFEETYGYSATSKEILIKNIGVSNSKIEKVISSDANFIIEDGNHDDIIPEGTNNSWKIKPRAGLDAGFYIADIKVIDKDGNTYTSTVKITVNKKELTGLGISLNSTYEYGNAIEPVITGTTELGIDDYKFVYSKNTGEELLDKPYKIGEYKVTLKVVSKNYYSDSEVTVEFSIVKKNVNTTMVIEGIKNYTYNGIAVEQKDLVIKDGDTELSKDFDYTLEYSDNINAGEVTITIKPVSSSNYTFDNVEEKFTIEQAEILSEFISLEKDKYKHTGFEIKPAVVVKDTNRNVYLSEIRDYEVSYENNIDIGDEAKVIITGTGNYKGIITKIFSIIDKGAQVIKFTDSTITKTYGDSKFPNAANHTEGNGVVKYTSSNTDVAEVNESTGEVTIKNAGTTEIKVVASANADFAEASDTYTLVVNKKKISYSATVSNKVFDNNKKAKVSNIEFTGLIGSETLEKDIDYTVSAEFASVQVGENIKVNINITLIDTDKTKNYELESTTYETKANITGKEILEAWVKVEEEIYTYSGSKIEPVVKVIDPTGETVLTLTSGTHYLVEYSDNTKAGTGKIKITGMGNYAGVINKEFTINKKAITPVIEDIPDVIYNGSEHTPNLVVKDGSTTLVKGTDYTVEYTNNLRAGSGYAEISEVDGSNYTFTTIGKSFNINKYEIKASDVILEYTSVVFDGNAKKPSVIVKMGTEVIQPIEYNVDYRDNINIGTATVKVTIKTDSDDFKGEVIKNFEIVNKILLNISGISNQQVAYTGIPVVLVGNLTVSNDINPSDLTVKWYKGSEEVSKPTNVGVYKVVYSYEDATYKGSLTVEFEITKKESIAPTLNDYNGVVGDKLSTISLPSGFKWVNSNENITAGNKEYNATYTENNDTTNYTTKNVIVKVYGKSKYNLNTSVNGLGGTISSSKSNILEGTTEIITLTPNTGFEIDNVLVNGVDKTSSVVNNKLNVTIDTSDVNVVVVYKVIQYTITINDIEHATIDPVGVIKVDYNTNKVFTIIADTGYNLVSVKVNGIERIDDLVDDELTLENILADTEIVIVVERNIYEVIEGANQIYTITKDNEAKFKIDAEYTKFERGGSVYVDGVLVDSSNYTCSTGSTIIVLKKKFVDSLSEGEHTLKVEFTDGEAATTFIVNNIIEENPQTGDNLVFNILTGIISIFGILGTLVYINKRKQTN